MSSHPFAIGGDGFAKVGHTVMIRLPGALKTTPAVILRRSQVTGVLTVELKEAAGAYKAGAAVHVQPYECGMEP